MSFLNPIMALIAAGITIPALVALYFLKLRRRNMVVPSTLLWKRAIQDLQVNSPFQKLRRNLLLLLQLLILIALLLALARPATRTAAEPGQRVAIVIDHSASMNATSGGTTSGGGTRLDAAKDKALELIDALAGGQAMVLCFAQSVKVVQQTTGDVTLLRRAVRDIEPTDQRSHLDEALKLVDEFALANAADASSESKMRVYVLSDGRIHTDQQEPLALRSAELTYVKIGAERQPDNLGIVSFAARRDADKPQLVRLHARLNNCGVNPVEANLTLSIDGQAVNVQPVQVSPGGSVQRQFELTMPDSALLRLSHDHGDDLTADNEAVLVLAPSRRLSVLLVSEGNAFLGSAVASVGVKRLVVMSPQKYENQDPATLARGGWDDGQGEGFDVIIFDSYAPRKVPPADSLSFGAAPPLTGLELKPARDGEQEWQYVLDWDRADPLMRYVVLDDVVIHKPGRLVVPAEARVLATGLSGPVIAAVPRERLQHVVVGFNLLDSYWPMYVSFPVFVSNVMRTLGLDGLGDEAALAYSTGQVATVPVTAGTEVIYTGPATMKRPVRHGEAVLESFEKVGVYVTSNPDVSAPFDRLAVNLLDALESDLRVADKIEVGAVDARGQVATASVRREVWRWFAWAALGVLLIEWLIYTRRMHL
ncbi:MAG: VWA domain-containing protein [Phycisphaeraceae bacterium]|nr:VWA domain-containing protein [Phycisphaeraceae bacterium]